MNSVQCSVTGVQCSVTGVQWAVAIDHVPRRGYDRQPRVAVLGYPGKEPSKFPNPNGVAAKVCPGMPTHRTVFVTKALPQPRWGWEDQHIYSQGS